jgi:Ca-activated chloride channel family protein
MISLGTFALLSPFWLCALPVVLVCAFFMRMNAVSLDAWRRAVDPHLLAVLARRGAVFVGARKRNLAIVFAAAIIAVALARPALERSDGEAFRNLDATLIVADLSSATGDKERIGQLRSAAQTIAANAGTRQLGLIVYAGDAYLANALTTDAETLDATIFALQPDTVPDPGDRPDRALALARHTLRDAGVAEADVVLVTAGATVDGAVMQEAADLQRNHYRLSTVAVAPSARSAVDIERSARLATLAAKGGGRTVDAAHIDDLVTDLRARPVERLGASEYAPLVWSDIGRLLLIGAAGATLTLFRKRTA